MAHVNTKDIDEWLETHQVFHQARPLFIPADESKVILCRVDDKLVKVEDQDQLDELLDVNDLRAKRWYLANREDV